MSPPGPPSCPWSQYALERRRGSPWRRTDSCPRGGEGSAVIVRLYSRAIDRVDHGAVDVVLDVDTLETADRLIDRLEADRSPLLRRFENLIHSAEWYGRR